VAVAEARLHDAGVAAVAVLVARSEHVEELLDHRDVADLGDRLAPRMQVAALAQRHELLDDRAQILRLGQRGGDLLVLDQRGRHVGKHGAAMLGRAVELAVGVTVTHRRGPFTPSSSCPRKRASTSCCLPFETWMAGPSPAMMDSLFSNDPQSAWPARRCSRAASR